ALPRAAAAQSAEARLVGTAAELEEAFRSAPDAGGRILLAPGRYDFARLRERSFSGPLVLGSADPAARAVFSANLHLEDVANLVIEGVDFVTGGFREHKGRMDKVQLGLTGCRAITVQDAGFTGYIPTAAEGVDPEAPNLDRDYALAGYGRDYGIGMSGCEGMRALGLVMSDLRAAIGCNRSRDIRMEGIEVARAREGINIHDVTAVTIAECHFHGFRPWLARASPRRDHPDMIQYWAGREGIGLNEVEIRDCLFHQGPGEPWTQTIFGHMQNVKDGTDRATGLRITGNTIVNRHVWGISLGDADGVVIADNLLLPSPDLPDAPERGHVPTISLERTAGAEISRNTLLPYDGLHRPVRAEPEALADGRVRLAPDNRLLSTRPVAPAFWRKLTPDLSSPAARYRARHGWTG
ncbi:right-handed parallel beta-helix repeat-containing protein, partial [Mangrovicoccus algicola]